jgi:hypothetical protein
MRTTILLVLAIALAATPAVAADCLDHGRHLTVKGTIVQSAFTVRPDATDYRVAVQRPFMAIALDFPRPPARRAEITEKCHRLSLRLR